MNSILVIAPQPFFEDRGTPIAVRHLVRAMCDLGVQVDLLTYPVGRDVSAPGLHIIRSGNPLRLTSVPVGFSLRKIALDVSLVWKLTRVLRRGRYQAVHALEEAAFPAALACRRLGIPLIYDMQSSLPEQLRELAICRTRIARAWVARCERWLVRRADTIICSAGLAEHVRSIDPQARVLEWSFPVVHELPDEAAVRSLRESLRLPPSARIVMYTGNFARYQGIDLLIAAAAPVRAQEPDVVFVLVGDTDDTRRTLRGEARALVDEGVVRLVPRCDSAEIPAYHAVADILVSPRSEGHNLGLKVFEYMAAAKPVIAVDSPTHRSVVDDTRALLVPATARDLAAGIVRLLRDPALAQQIARAAHEFAREHLAWASFLAQVEYMYGRVGVGRGARADKKQPPAPGTADGSDLL